MSHRWSRVASVRSVMSVSTSPSSTRSGPEENHASAIMARWREGRGGGGRERRRQGGVGFHEKIVKKKRGVKYMYVRKIVYVS